MLRIKIAFLTILSVVILAGCGSSPKKQEASVDTEAASEFKQAPEMTEDQRMTEQLVKAGKPVEAAMMLLKMAAKAEGERKDELQLEAIQLLLEGRMLETAKNLLAEIDPLALIPSHKSWYAFLNAQLAVSNRNALETKKWLADVNPDEVENFTTQKDYLTLLVANSELAGDNQAIALNRIKLANYLSSDDASLQNQQAIIRNLLLLPQETLQTLMQSEQDPIARQWMDLGLLIKKSKNPFRLASLLKSWKELNSTHPVSNALIASLAPQQEDEPPVLNNIAVLLPLSGAFQKYAHAIKDGILASYYGQEAVTSRPTIRFYDTANESKTIAEIYQLALSEGANLIVGPLQKEKVEELFAILNPTVPILALNQLENLGSYKENFYQFALSPENEAQQVARRAWYDGHNRAAIIFPENSWGSRVSEAFKREWEILGGHVVSEIAYQSRNNDFSNPIKTLLAIDKSNERKNELSKLLRTTLTFEPRRRQDIDCIFMASFPRQARLIPPQLKFFHAEGIPIYTTSHSFSGKVDRKNDRDLNAVIIGDMPWTLTGSKDNSTKTQIYRTWPDNIEQLNRFYAFGVDAYQVLYYLNWLRSNSNSRLQGETGQLYMNENNQILRELSWAKFQAGKPVVMQSAASLQ